VGHGQRGRRNAGVNLTGNIIWHPDPAATGGNIPCDHCGLSGSGADYRSFGFFCDGGRDSTVVGNLLVLDGSNGRWVGDCAGGPGEAHTRRAQRRAQRHGWGGVGRGL
jgi:hypothetical protein